MTIVYDNKGQEIKDPTAMRFGKAKVWANIELQQGHIEERFLQVEGKKYRDGCGTKQCATQEGLSLHEQWNLLHDIGQDITQQWG